MLQTPGSCELVEQCCALPGLQCSCRQSNRLTCAAAFVRFVADVHALYVSTGDDVLNWLSFGHTSIPKTLGSEARILAFYYWLTYCILKAGKPKFEAIQAPAAAGTAAEQAEGSKTAVSAAAAPKAEQPAAVVPNGAA